MDNILTVKNFSITYQGKKVLDNINFSINRGDYLVVGGVPGSGKTTLMKSILGIFNKGIEGEIKFHSIKPDEVSYIPQNIMLQKDDFIGTVREVIAISLLPKLKGRPFGEEQWEKVDFILKKLNIFDIKDKKINKLNHSQIIKVTFAKYLIHNPQLIFIDSPNSTLDVKYKIEFYKLIKELSEKEKLTFIFITNNIKESCNYANKLLFLNKKDKSYYFGDITTFIQEKFKSKK